MTISNTVEWDIRPFRHIRVGDPSYFESLEAGDPGFDHLVVDTKTRCCTCGFVRVKDDRAESGDLEVSIWLASKPEQLEVYKKNRWYGEKTLKNQVELGCDTACFELEVDERFMEFHTGSDGFFGQWEKFKEYYGCHLTLFFDAALHSLDELIRDFEYLFPRLK